MSIIAAKPIILFSSLKSILLLVRFSSMVVDMDIFASGFNFVFGKADITGRRALISLQRLRQEFYGLPKNENLFQERVLKETVHELGHTYGLKSQLTMFAAGG